MIVLNIFLGFHWIFNYICMFFRFGQQRKCLWMRRVIEGKVFFLWHFLIDVIPMYVKCHRKRSSLSVTLGLHRELQRSVTEIKLFVLWHFLFIDTSFISKQIMQVCFQPKFVMYFWEVVATYIICPIITTMTTSRGKLCMCVERVDTPSSQHQTPYKLSRMPSLSAGGTQGGRYSSQIWWADAEGRSGEETG